MTQALHKLSKQTLSSAREIREGWLAWEIADFEVVLQELMHANVAILGGDVFSPGQAGPEWFGNWYAERRAGETIEAYRKRSWEIARDYFSGVRKRSAALLILPVISDQTSAGY